MIRAAVVSRLLAIMLVASPSIRSADAQEGRLIGRVVDAETRRPLPGATVLVEPGERGDATDVDGRFAFERVPAGRYVVRVRFLGFEPVVRADVEVVPGRATVVEVALHPAVYEADEVVVSAGWFDDASDEPAPVLLFSREEIRRAAGAAGDVQRLLAGLPAVARMDDMRNALAVRGGSPMETRFVVDGIPVPNLNHFPTQGASGGALGIVAADLIDDVTFRPGGFGAEYGDRLGAIVDLDLRSSTDRPVAFRGDFSIAGMGAFVEGAAADRRLTWLAGARRSWVDLLVTGFLEEQADAIPTYSDAVARAVWRPSPGHEILLLDLASVDRSGIERPDAEEQHENYYGTADFDANTAGIRWTALRGETGLGVTTLSHAWSARRVRTLRTSTGASFLEDHADEFSLRASHTERIGLGRAASIELGVEVEREVGLYETRMDESSVVLDPRLSRTRAGTHATLALRPLPAIRLEPGVRVDRVVVRTRFQPRGAIHVRVRPDLWARVAAGLYVQQLPMALVAQSADYAALPAPEAVHVVSGLSWEPAEALRVTLDAYLKRYRRLPLDPEAPFSCALDMIYDDALSMPGWPAYGSLSADGIARARGIELAVQQRLARRIYGLASIGLNRSEYRDLTGVWRPRLFENGLIVTVDGGWRPNERHQVGIRFTWAGGRPFTPFDEQASVAAGTGVPDVDLVHGRRLPDYHALAVRYDRRFSVAGTWIVAYASIWNVYGRRNLSGWYWDEVEERPRERVQWGLLPIVGFEIVFR